MSRTAGRAKTLPGEYYTSDEVYALEGERIFARRWIYAGRAGQIARSGSYLILNQDQESIILLRDGERIRGFHNVCRHRGTRLCREETGQFSKSIQCPYHAWTYALSGELIGAPNMHEVPGFELSDFALRPVHTAIWEGCLFVNFAASPEPFEKSLAPLVNKFGDWQLDELEVGHTLTYDIRANWKFVMQNYSECYHCPNLHPQLNRLTPYRLSSNDLEEGAVLGGPMHFAEGFASMTLTGQACAAPLKNLSAEDLGRVYYYVVFPNMLLSLHPDYVLIHQIQRLAPDRTRIICDWLFHPEALAHPDFDPRDAVEFWNITNQQDWEVCERSQQGVQSSAYEPGPYAELESMIAALDREYLRSLDEAP